MKQLSDKQKKFVQSYVSTGSGVDAAIAAGYGTTRASSSVQASRLMKKEQIIYAIEALRARADELMPADWLKPQFSEKEVECVKADREDLTAKAHRAYSKAMESNQISAAVGALNFIARLHGLIDEKDERSFTAVKATINVLNGEKKQPSYKVINGTAN